MTINDSLFKGVSLGPERADLILLALQGSFFFQEFLACLLSLDLLVGSHFVFALSQVVFQLLELSGALLFHTLVEVSKTLFKLSAHLLDYVSRVVLEFFFALHSGFVLALCLCTILGLVIKAAQTVKIFSLSLHVLLEFIFLDLHLIDLGLLVPHEGVLVLGHLTALLFSHTLDNAFHHGVGEETGKDLSFLLNLLLLDNSNLVSFAVHSLALDITSDLAFFLAVLFLESVEFLLQIAINVLFLGNHFFDHLLVSRATNDGVKSALSVFSLTAQGSLSCELLLHHSKNLFLELNGLLFVQLE